jgi:uncharacterized protein (PEP-CTERM system associated)
MKRPRATAAEPHTVRHPTAAVLLLLAGALPAAALAQDTPAGRGISVAAYVDSSADFAVNSRLGGRDAGDLTLVLQPGVAMAGRTGRAYGSLNYSVGFLQRERRGAGGSDNEVNHNLAAQLSAELIDRWMYFDGNATIGRQTASPFGLQGVGNSAPAQASTVEVYTTSLSPYVQGTVGTAATYEVRLNANATNARRSLLADSVSWGGSASLSSPLGTRLLAWSLVASSQETDFRAGNNTRNDRWSASLSWIPDPDLSLTVRGGEEVSDVAVLERTRYANWGGGVSWRPSTRTRVQLDGDDRYFGTSYRLVLEHRTPQFAFQAGSSRSDNSGQPSRVPVTAYQLRDSQLTSLIPDPSARQQQVLADLALLGISPDAVVFSSLVTSAITVVERTDASLGYTGRILTASVQAYFENSRIADTLGRAPEPVRRKGYSGNVGYRLGPDSNLLLAATWLTTLPSSTLPGNNLKSATATVDRALARRTRASLGLRYSVFNSATDPYREAALTARLNHRF